MLAASAAFDGWSDAVFCELVAFDYSSQRVKVEEFVAVLGVSSWAKVDEGCSMGMAVALRG